MSLERVLVTGGAGFIGSAFVRLLLDQDPLVQVWNLDVLTAVGGNLHNLDGVGDPRHRLVRGDVEDQELVTDLVATHDIDTIVHFAAQSHVDRSIAGPAAFVRTNVGGTLSVLEAARQHWLRPGHDAAGCRFHQVSTDEVFGDRGADDNIATETTLRQPRSPYAASKAAADHLVHSYQHTYGLPVSLTFSCNNLGPRQHPEKLVPLVILRAMAGQPLPLYGDGLQIRRWLHVDDHCRALLAVLQADAAGRSFAVGPVDGTPNLELVRRLCGLLDERLPAGAPHFDLVHHVADRPGHDRVYHTAADRIRQELGWRPQRDLDQALADTVDWYLAHPDWIARAAGSAAYQRWLSEWYGQRGG